MSKKISYSAIVLDNQSREKLLIALENSFPKEFESWEVICHHMTICMGELPPNLKKDIGQSVDLTVVKGAHDDKVIAVGVYGAYSKNSTNETPHITLAVNRKNGGKPVMSNNLTNWELISNPIYITGTVQEL